MWRLGYFQAQILRFSIGLCVNENENFGDDALITRKSQMGLSGGKSVATCLGLSFPRVLNVQRFFY